MPPVIKVKMTQSPPFADGDAPVGDDLVWVWDVSAGVLRKAAISSLPFSSGGGGGGGGETVTSPSPFMVFAGDANITYNAVTNTTTVRDTRLKNKTLYPVFATQYGGGELNPEMISYMDIDPDDDTKGRLTITGFQLDDEAHLTLIVPGDISSSDTAYLQLLADVALLKLIAAPFYKTALGPNGGKVFWGKPANEIPAGWQEYTGMRGKVPVAQDPDDDDFSATIGTPGGSKEAKLKATDIPELNGTLRGPWETGDSDRGTKPSSFSIDNVRDNEFTVGTPDAEMTKVNLMNPYRIVMWIEFIGI